MYELLLFKNHAFPAAYPVYCNFEPHVTTAVTVNAPDVWLDIIIRWRTTPTTSPAVDSTATATADARHSFPSSRTRGAHGQTACGRSHRAVSSPPPSWQQYRPRTFGQCSFSRWSTTPKVGVEFNPFTAQNNNIFIVCDCLLAQK